MEKRAQMKISFGMIFSIILIIAFLAFAFYAIKNFLLLSDAAKIGQFRDKFQKDVNDLWKSAEGSQEVSYSLPRKIDQACFRNDEVENLILLPSEVVENVPRIFIEHLNLSRIPSNSRKCFDLENSRLTINLEKDFGKNLVEIK